MPNTFTEQTFRSTYKDDHADSDNYSRILFNAGRALQARELTQMQTIIQKEIKRFADNIFQKDGVPTKAGGIAPNNHYAFIKIENDQNNSFDDISALKGVVLTGADSSIKVKIYEAVAAENSDPDTLYVQYLDNPNTQSPSVALTSNSFVTPGEVLSNGSNINLTVQTINTVVNPSTGYGSQVEIGQSEFYVQGHFIFCDKQSLFLDKYNNYQTADIGFKVIQDIVTVTDTDALYDNQNVTPNRASPGADRYRIRLQLIRRDQIVNGDTFVYLARIESGILVDQQSDDESFNRVRDHVATRVREINGDFIQKYWKLRVEPNGTNASSTLMLKIDPGTAYIGGYRAATSATRSIPIPKAKDTILRDEEQIGIDYGNYYYFDSGVGMLDIDTCEKVTLYAGFDGADSAIGTAHIRALTEGSTGLRTGGYTYVRPPLYKAHLFDIQRNNFNYSLRDVKSIKSLSNSHLVNLVQTTGNLGSIVHEPKKNALLFDTPLRRPKSFTNATMTFMKKYNFTTASGTSHTITLTDVGESFVNEGDIIVASATEFAPSGVASNIQSGNKDILFSGLSNGVAYEAIVFVRKTNATVKTKTLTEDVVTASLDSDGAGVYYLPLGKSDVYSIKRVSLNDSDGEDVFTSFIFDAGNRTTHQDDGRLIYSGGGFDSAGQSIFVRYQYFQPSVSGQFYAVNSYDGQLDYLKVPGQKLPDGGKLSLRDALDFRPSTDGSGSFTTIPPLPVPTDTITTDAEYYLPRADRLVISKQGELRYITGSSSLNPKYPEIPVDCIDLYKLRLNANTMHSQDLRTTLIPRKGYTMQDINKLEEKVDRLEEMTTLSLLELNTKMMNVLDSAGNDRAKSGFFVDNFKSHSHSQTKSPEYRAAIDKRGKLLRPTFVEDCADLFYDSDHVGQLRTGVFGDFVMLNHTEIAYEAQELASGTENLAPFYVPTIVGSLELSPETDSWKETQKIGETVVGRSSEFDLKHALNWNNSENEWFGVDPSDLEAGDAATSFVSGTSTSVTHNSSDPVLIGTETTETLGEWVEVGHVTDVETLYTETVEVSREREEEISRTVIDSGWNGDYWYGWGGNYTGNYITGIGGGYSNGYYGIPWTEEQTTTDMWDVVTTETRDKVKTVNTSTYETTRTIETENAYESTTDTTTTTTTSNTVNRIASESTIRDIVGKKIIDVSVIPFMRSIEIEFKAEGLRPNTQYFPFFDGSNVSSFCREQTKYRTSHWRTYLQSKTFGDGEGVQRTTQRHSSGNTNLISDAEGTITGSFEVPNNQAMRFYTGTREFALLDVNVNDFTAAMSYSRAMFHSKGVLEEYEDEIEVTRVLKIVGNSTSDVDRSVSSSSTVWTESVISTETATDVKSTETYSTLVGDTTSTKEHVGETSEVSYLNQITPVNHVTDTTVPPGGAVTDKGLTLPERNNRRGKGGVSYRLQDGRLEYHDPIAQTFLVKQIAGVFITSVDVYFASKSSSAPVFCELRPTVNGVPSSSKIITSKKLSASQVTLVPEGSTNKQMLQNATTFTFDHPVFVAGGEYAIVLRPGNNDPDYNVYVATVGERQLNSNEAFISQQTTLGGFFKSQNAKLWEPSSGQDLAYRINVAKFETSGNAILENANIPPVSLSKDPLVVDSGSNTVRVMFKGHGLRDGDKTWIRGIDSATDFGNGLTGADVNGVRTVVAFDNSGYTYQATSSATSRKWFGGSSVTSQRNMNFEVLRPEIDIKQPGETNYTMSVKTTSQSALAGSQVRFVKDASYNIIENKKNNEFTNPRAIFNRRTENLSTSGKLNGERSTTVQLTLKTTNPYLSPVIDLQRAKLNTVHNLISRQDSSATDGFNVPLSYVGENNPLYGTESAKHVTKITTLTEQAVGLKILLAANRPPESDFQVYWKVASAGDDIKRSAWTLVNSETVLPVDTNKNIFREYRYLVGGDGGTMSPFTQFQVKIVMRSTNSAKVPSFRDLRIISLAV